MHEQFHLEEGARNLDLRPMYVTEKFGPLITLGFEVVPSEYVNLTFEKY